jgi:hypothetical protein
MNYVDFVVFVFQVSISGCHLAQTSALRRICSEVT